MMANRTNPPTRYQKGRRWATITLAICGTFSLYANVRSGVFTLESVIWSGFPPLVLFMTVHVISYLSPRSKPIKVLVWLGLGFVVIVAFGASGYHIVTQAMQNGQPWYTALCYPFLADIPSLMCAAILVKKDTVTRTTTKEPEVVQTAPTPAKRTTPAKKTVPAKTTKPPAKKATPAKVTKPSILNDPFEMDKLNV